MLWKKRNYDFAYEATKKAQQKYPDDIDLMEKEGEILLESEYIDLSIDVFLKLNERFPDRYHILLSLGDAFYKKNDFAAAEKYLTDALNAKTWDPTYLLGQFEIMEMLANIYYKQKDYEKAGQYLESILQVQPKAAKWQLYFKILDETGAPEDRLEDMRVIYHRVKIARRYAARAARYESRQSYELAIKNYKKAMEINPYEPLYPFCAASMLEKLPEDEYENQFNEATFYYRTACELFPNNPFYALSYVSNLISTNFWQEAFEGAKIISLKFPELILPCLRFLTEALGIEDQFVEVLKHLIELDTEKELSEIRTELALILKERNDPEYAIWFNEAAEIYLEKIKLHPYDWRNYFDYASCKDEINELEESHKYLIKALEYHKDFSVDIAERLSSVLIKLGYFKDARMLIETIILTTSGNYEYYGKLGMCLLEEKEYEKAFDAFNNSVAMYPYTPEYIYGAGVCAAYLNRDEDVVNVIKDLLLVEDKFIEIIEQEPAFKKYYESPDFSKLMDEVKKKREERNARTEQDQ
jgi:tetratricopeptide (TPR) repeat protein